MEPGRLVQVGPLAMSVGGCVGNTGLALAALGVPARLVASVGQDRLGDALVAMLAGAGLAVEGIARLPDRGTSYSIVMDVPGRDRTIWHHIGANEAFTGEGAMASIRAAGTGGIVHFGYPTHLPGLYGDGGKGLIELVEETHAAGATISIDMAEIDPLSAAHSVDWRALLTRILPSLDILKASVDDLFAALGGREGRGALEWADELLSLGARAALVTAGAEGLCLRTGAATGLGDEWRSRELWAAPIARRVIVTTGAGDTAAAGFLAGLADGRSPEECVALACRAAAARISGRSLAEAWQLDSLPAAAPPRRPGWSIDRYLVHHGSRDKEVSQC
jgi:sugar/nucleoside kinase (ribokinase family)